MRNYTITAMISALALLASCEKVLQPEATGAEESRLCLSVTLNEPATKADNITFEYLPERNIVSVSYYVFDSKGRLEAVVSKSNAAQVTIKVSSGTKTIWAAVNIPESRFSGVTTLSQFESKEVSFADFGASSFPMSGKKEGVYVGTGTVTFSIPVERFVSRICVAEVINNLTGKFAGCDMELSGVFLSNVAGNCKITGAVPSTRLWYNKFGRVDGGSREALILCYPDASYSDFTYGETSGSVVPHGEKYEDGFCLYLFPNPTASDVTGWSSTFTPRYTRVVTAVYIDGETYYYPVNLVGTLRNHAYTLYLTITHLGSRDPESFDFVEIQDVTVTVGGFDEFDDDFEITF